MKRSERILLETRRWRRTAVAEAAAFGLGIGLLTGLLVGWWTC